MFKLVEKRYWFLAISLIVIIPGVISLGWKHLNVGIDFAGGSSLSLRPAVTYQANNTTGTTTIRNILAPLGLKDLQVTLNTDNSLASNPTVWIRLNTTIDSNVESTITKDLQGKYPGVKVFSDQMPVNGKNVTIITVTNFPKGVTPKTADIQSLLNKLPNTTDTTKSPTPTTSPTASPQASPTAGQGTPTATANATATAQAHATATAQAHATATAQAHPTATATATATTTTNQNNPANIPVKVQDVKVSTGTQTISILTATTINEQLQAKITGAFAGHANNYVQVLQSSSVQGSVAAQTQTNAVLAVLAASVLILLYIWFAFRKVSKPWRYGVCAIIALLHDVLVVLGISSILGWTIGFQVDSLFITALLTVVGFSVHDTIVVFDRIRENMQRRTSETFEEVVDASLVQTMARSLNTSLTVLITLAALTLFGGVSIRSFTGTLLLGIFTGTYSSIFNASMFLVIWERGELGLGRFRRKERLPDGREARRSRERELARSRG